MCQEQLAAPRYRAVRFGNAAPAQFRFEEQGIIRVQAGEALQPFPERLLSRLVDGARLHPERTFVARRDAGGDWRRISYAEMLALTRTIAQALLERDLSRERPVLILSGNDLEHLQLGFAAMWAGIPYCPISPAYSLLSEDFGKLRHVLKTLTPGLVFAADGGPYARALAQVPEGVELVLGQGSLPGRRSTPFTELLSRSPTAQVDQAFADTGPGTIVKFLFTSGSTRDPKAVPTTNRMLCANQQMLLQCFPFLADEGPVLLDWLPWSHTFGGSHNLGIALYNGGTYYIDDGKPTSAAFGETLRNLRDIAPTVYFTVPKAWEDISQALALDTALAKNFFSRVNMFMYAGASLAQGVWDRLDSLAERICGERIVMVSGLGMTEASPTCTFALRNELRAGQLGLPVPGCVVKMVPCEGKLEARFAGPHIMQGYWRNPQQTATAFDEEGFYCTGDALRLIDETDLQSGFQFDGRLAEDFKLSSGTFVSVGPLRGKVIARGAPYIQDVVVAGLDRSEIALLIFPNLKALAALLRLPENSRPEFILFNTVVREFFQALIDDLHHSATGSATRPMRAIVLLEPPSSDKGEITDKGSINQRAVLSQRQELIEQLYRGRAERMILPGKAPMGGVS